MKIKLVSLLLIASMVGCTATSKTQYQTSRKYGTDRTQRPARLIAALGVIMRTRVVFVDVDDTLVRSVGSKRIPMPAVVEAIRALHKGGAQLYLWSSGGADYAKSSAVELGIEGLFLGFLPKPDVYVDDQPVQEWAYCRHVLPGNAVDAAH